MTNPLQIQVFKSSLIQTMQTAIRAPLISSPFGKSRMAIHQESKLSCMVELADQVQVRLATVIPELGIGMEALRATYSFTRSEWKIKSVLSQTDCDNILSSPIVDSILSHLLAERKKLTSMDMAMKGVNS